MFNRSVDPIHYQGTLGGVAVNFSYAGFAQYDLPSGPILLDALYGDYESSALCKHAQVEVYNDEVICVVEKPEGSNVYEISSVVHGMSDADRQEWKLDVKTATNLPPEFVHDNYVSRKFPFLASVSNAGSLEEHTESHFYVVISTHSGKR